MYKQPPPTNQSFVVRKQLCKVDLESGKLRLIWSEDNLQLQVYEYVIFQYVGL